MTIMLNGSDLTVTHVVAPPGMAPPSRWLPRDRHPPRVKAALS